mmetsp:Transcript_10766/g.31869  ORF Transcript_10766/g.31869 Transcript_10766/m.31869 type:complete len:212 (-) Transcript_10766:1587-2222(-)
MASIPPTCASSVGRPSTSPLLTPKMSSELLTSTTSAAVMNSLWAGSVRLPSLSITSPILRFRPLSSSATSSARSDSSSRNISAMRHLSGTTSTPRASHPTVKAAWRQAFPAPWPMSRKISEGLSSVMSMIRFVPAKRVRPYWARVWTADSPAVLASLLLAPRNKEDDSICSVVTFCRASTVRHRPSNSRVEKGAAGRTRRDALGLGVPPIV